MDRPPTRCEEQGTGMGVPSGSRGLHGFGPEHPRMRTSVNPTAQAFECVTADTDSHASRPLLWWHVIHISPGSYPILDASIIPSTGRAEFLQRLGASLVDAGVTLLEYRNKTGTDAELLADAAALREVMPPDR